MKRCGELGLLGVDVAEEYGGVELDKVTSMVVSASGCRRSASFGATFGAQANLMVLPLSLFGTEAQKRQYLPRLLTGEIVGAYCLSEPGSGSDALGAKTRAVRQADGSFVLNGEKMWITNGGFADLFIVFAKVVDDNGEHFSRLHRRARVPGRDRAARKSTRWGCTARRRRPSSSRTSACRRRTCSARSARATRSRSTC